MYVCVRCCIASYFVRMSVDRLLFCVLYMYILPYSYLFVSTSQVVYRELLGLLSFHILSLPFLCYFRWLFVVDSMHSSFADVDLVKDISGYVLNVSLTDCFCF